MVDLNITITLTPSHIQRVAIKIGDIYCSLWFISLSGCQVVM